MISILVGQVPSSLSYFYGRFPSTRLRTGRTRLRISGSPLKSQSILPEWTLKWQLQHKAMVFPRLAIISLSAYPLPSKAFTSLLPITPIRKSSAYLTYLSLLYPLSISSKLGICNLVLSITLSCSTAFLRSLLAVTVSSFCIATFF